MEAAAQRVKLGQMLVKSPFSFLAPLPSFLLSQCCSVDHRARCWLIEDVVSVCPPSFSPPRLRCSLSQMVSCRRTMTLSWVFTTRQHRAMFSSSPCSPQKTSFSLHPNSQRSCVSWCEHGIGGRAGKQKGEMSSAKEAQYFLAC